MKEEGRKRERTRNRVRLSIEVNYGDSEVREGRRSLVRRRSG